MLRIGPAGSAPRQALAALVRAARRLRSAAGFRQWQSFRAMDESDALIVLTDWESTAAFQRAAAELQLEALGAAARGWGMTLAPIAVLSREFDRQLTRRPGRATLLRVAARQEPEAEDPRRDSDLALQALAAPGSLRLYGARSSDGRTGICRIDFDTEDGIWHFLESPLRQAWSEAAREGREAESWAINLPRLEFRRISPTPSRSRRSAGPRESLSIHLDVLDEGRRAEIQLQGHVDGHGSERCERFCQALIAGGCVSLQVDLSGLTTVSAEALAMLTRTARYLKKRGGQFILIDSVERVRRVTRSKHLESSLK